MSHRLSHRVVVDGSGDFLGVLIGILPGIHEVQGGERGNIDQELGFSNPESSGLHVHPLTEEGSELGDQISVISSEKQKKGGGLTHQLSDVSRFASAGWHSDITFEKAPSDYAMLKIHTLPKTGGDTVRTVPVATADRPK